MLIYLVVKKIGCGRRSARKVIENFCLVMPSKIAWRNISFTIPTPSDWELADNWLFKFQDKYLYFLYF